MFFVGMVLRVGTTCSSSVASVLVYGVLVCNIVLLLLLILIVGVCWMMVVITGRRRLWL
jgi:hypothetical protein